MNEVPVVKVKVKNTTKSVSKDKYNNKDDKVVVENTKIASKKTKSSRPQTAYNIFMKIKMTEIELPIKLKN